MLNEWKKQYNKYIIQLNMITQSPVKSKCLVIITDFTDFLHSLFTFPNKVVNSNVSSFIVNFLCFLTLKHTAGLVLVWILLPGEEFYNLFIRSRARLDCF